MMIQRYSYQVVDFWLLLKETIDNFIFQICSKGIYCKVFIKFHFMICDELLIHIYMLHGSRAGIS